MKSNKTKSVNPYTALSQEKQKLYASLAERHSKTLQMEITDNQLKQVMAEDENELLIALRMIETFGCHSVHAANLLLGQLNGFANRRGQNVGEINQMLGLIADINPQDDIEAMLACQMIVAHSLSMESAKWAHLKEQTFEGKQMNINHTVKLMRTYTQQMEALKKYRRNANQKMTVEHVHVNEGGQAIIGNVNGGKK